MSQGLLFEELSNSFGMDEGDCDLFLHSLVVDWVSGLRFAHSQEEHDFVIGFLSSAMGERILKLLGVRDDRQQEFVDAVDRLGSKKIVANPRRGLGMKKMEVSHG